MHRSRLMNARFCVLAKLDSELPTEVEIESDGRSIVQGLFYEVEGFKCAKCKSKGHLPFQCPGVPQREGDQMPRKEENEEGRVKGCERLGKEESREVNGGPEIPSKEPEASGPSCREKGHRGVGESDGDLAFPPGSVVEGCSDPGELGSGNRRGASILQDKSLGPAEGRVPEDHIVQSGGTGRELGAGDSPSPTEEPVLEGLAKNINWELEDYLSEPEEGILKDRNPDVCQTGSVDEGAAGSKGTSERGGGGTRKWVSKGGTSEVRRAPDFGHEKKVGRPPKKATREKETQAQIDMGVQSTLKEGGVIEGPNLRSRRV